MRSKKLIENLSSEKIRWSQIENEFQKQLATITGNSVLSSAFINYAGFYEEEKREFLVEKWKKILKKYFVRFEESFNIDEVLSTFEQKQAWKLNMLPEDQVYSQNALILERFKKYPLIIDPSGQAL